MFKRVLMLSLAVILLLGACTLPEDEQPTPTMMSFPSPLPPTATETAVVAAPTATNPPVDEVLPTFTPPPMFTVTPTSAEPTEEPGPPSGTLLYETRFTDLAEIQAYWKIFAWWQAGITAYAEPGFNPRIKEIPYEIKNNALHVELLKYWTDLAIVYPTGETYPDLEVRLDTRLVYDPKPTYVSAICRYAEAGWYEFYVSTKGEWAIWRVDVTSGAYNRVTNLLSGKSNAIVTDDPKAENHLVATCADETLSFSVNGRYLGQVVDDTYPRGYFGVGLATRENGNSRMEYDRLRVFVP